MAHNTHVNRASCWMFGVWGGEGVGVCVCTHAHIFCGLLCDSVHLDEVTCVQLVFLMEEIAHKKT